MIDRYLSDRFFNSPEIEDGDFDDFCRSCQTWDEQRAEIIVLRDAARFLARTKIAGITASDLARDFLSRL